MDIRKTYFLTTKHMVGNYNKIGKRLYSKTQSIGLFFENAIMQRICEVANNGAKKVTKLDLFIFIIYKYGDINTFFAILESSTRPDFEQVDDFLYPIIPDHEMYRDFNEKYGRVVKAEKHSIFKELLKHPEIKIILNNYVRYLSLTNSEYADSVKNWMKILIGKNGEKIDDNNLITKNATVILSNMQKWYEEIWFSLDERKIEAYDALDEEYTKRLSELKKKQSKTISLEKRRMDKLVDLYNFKSKTKGIFDNIVGQREQLNQIMQALYNAQLGLNNINGPRASMLLTGPTGVGKTETAFAISNSLYQKDPFVIDLSVYRGEHQLSTLIGSPPGYVGYNDKPAFLEYIKENASTGGVLLFDEFDKANPQVLNIFMHMLDKGEVQSAKGQCYSVQNFIIITTSNITEKVNKRIGFGTEDESIKNTISSNAIGSIPPELIARFDLVIAYEHLSKEEKIELAKRKMDIVCSKISNLKEFLNVKIKYDESVLEELANGVNESMGIRELFRDVNNLATKKLVEYIMTHDDFTDFAIYIKSLNNIIVKPIPKTKQSIELKEKLEKRLTDAKSITMEIDKDDGVSK